jgi:hypothetical protein
MACPVPSQPADGAPASGAAEPARAGLRLAGQPDEAADEGLRSVPAIGPAAEPPPDGPSSGGGGRPSLKRIK